MTKDTMPRHIWKHHVFEISQISWEDAKPYMDKLDRWYNAGEPYAMAAHDLKFLVKEGARQIRLEQQERADNIARYLRED